MFGAELSRDREGRSHGSLDTVWQQLGGSERQSVEVKGSGQLFCLLEILDIRPHRISAKIMMFSPADSVSDCNAKALSSWLLLISATFSKPAGNALRTAAISLLYVIL